MKIKRVLSLLLVMSMVLSFMSFSYATDISEIDNIEKEVEIETNVDNEIEIIEENKELEDMKEGIKNIDLDFEENEESSDNEIENTDEKESEEIEDFEEEQVRIEEDIYNILPDTKPLKILPQNKMLRAGSINNLTAVIRSDGTLNISMLNKDTEDGDILSPTIFDKTVNTELPWNNYKSQILHVKIEPVSESALTYISNMNEWFKDCENLIDVDLNGMNVPVNMNFCSTFENCISLEKIENTSWFDKTVADADWNMTNMFKGCVSLKNFSIKAKIQSQFCKGTYASVKDIDFIGMFDGCSSLEEVDLSGFIDSCVPKRVRGDKTVYNRIILMSDMFKDCISLKNVKLPKIQPEITNQGTKSTVTISGEPFSNTPKLETVYVTTNDNPLIRELPIPDSSLPGAYDVFKELGFKDGYYTYSAIAEPVVYVVGNTLLFTDDITKTEYNDKTIVLGPIPKERFLNTTAKYAASNDIPWNDIRGTILKIDFQCPIYPSNTAFWFFGMAGLKEIVNIENLHTDYVTNMSHMFDGCFTLTNLEKPITLTEIDVSNFKTSNVTDMSYMFNNCFNLETISGCENWDTSKVTNMKHMFSGNTVIGDMASYDYTVLNSPKHPMMLKNIDVSGWNTSNVTNMNQMFETCAKIEYLDVSNWDMHNVEDVAFMFDDCRSLKTLDVSKWFDPTQYNEPIKTKNLWALFRTCINLEVIDVSKWDTSSFERFAQMFEDCESVKELAVENWDISNIEYDDCRNNLEGLNNGKLNGLWSMFENCKSLTSLDLHKWNTSRVNTISNIFYNCENLIDLNVSGWDTSNVVNMAFAFALCHKIENIDLSTWDVSEVINMRGMFNSDSNLRTLNLSGWNTTKVEYLSTMFEFCRNLENVDLSGFKGKIKWINTMFEHCYNLKKLDLSGLDIRKISDGGGGSREIFKYCFSLEEVTVGENWVWGENKYVSDCFVGFLPTQSETQVFGDVTYTMPRANGKWYSEEAEYSVKNGIDDGIDASLTPSLEKHIWYATPPVPITVNIYTKGLNQSDYSTEANIIHHKYNGRPGKDYLVDVDELKDIYPQLENMIVDMEKSNDLMIKNVQINPDPETGEELGEEIDIYLYMPCIVHFDSRGGTSVEDKLVEPNNLVEEPEPPTRKGYIFKGWVEKVDIIEDDLSKSDGIVNIAIKDDKLYDDLNTLWQGLTISMPTRPNLRMFDKDILKYSFKTNPNDTLERNIGFDITVNNGYSIEIVNESNVNIPHKVSYSAEGSIELVNATATVDNSEENYVLHANITMENMNGESSNNIYVSVVNNETGEVGKYLICAYFTSEKDKSIRTTADFSVSTQANIEEKNYLMYYKAPDIGLKSIDEVAEEVYGLNSDNSSIVDRINKVLNDPNLYVLVKTDTFNSSVILNPIDFPKPGIYLVYVDNPEDGLMGAVIDNIVIYETSFDASYKIGNLNLYSGDLNHDGSIDIKDLNIFSEELKKLEVVGVEYNPDVGIDLNTYVSTAEHDIRPLDINKDGVVNFEDEELLFSNRRKNIVNDSYKNNSYSTIQKKTYSMARTVSEVDSIETGELFDFNTPITHETFLYAIWELTSNVEYDVEHYFYNSDSGEYELYKTETFAADFGEVVEAQPLNEIGYKVDLSIDGTIEKDRISSEDKVVLKLYYNICPVYTITFNPNNGEEIIEVKVNEGDKIPTDSIPVLKGEDNKYLDGWLDEEGNKFDFETVIIKDITLTANWKSSDIKPPFVDIENPDKTPASFVEVWVKQGNTEFKHGFTDAIGRFSLSEIPAGYYNLIVEKDKVIETSIIQITENFDGITTIVLGQDAIDSVLRVNEGTKDVVVGYLNTLYTNTNFYTKEDESLVEDGGIVAFTMNVVSVPETIIKVRSPDLIVAANSDNKQISGYLQMDISKVRVSAEGETLSNEPLTDLQRNLLEIHIPLHEEQQGHKGYTVYRMHEGKVYKITEVPNENGAYIEILNGNDLVVHASKFSDYCLAWDKDKEPDKPTPPSSGGSSSGGSSSGGNSKPKYPFEDVKKDDWFFEEIYDVYNKGLIDPVCPKKFDPFGQLDRADTAHIFYQLNKVKSYTFDKDRFDDVTERTKYAKDIIWADDNEVMIGYGHPWLGSFGPRDSLTREQFALVLWRVFSNHKHPGPWPTEYIEAGNKVSDWAAYAMCWCVKEGLLQGNENGDLMPQKAITRSEASAVINRLIKNK